MATSAAYAQHIVALQALYEQKCRTFQEKLFPAILDREQACGASPEVFKQWYRLKRCICKNLPCSESLVEYAVRNAPEIAEWLHDWQTMRETLATTQAEYARWFESELQQVRESLYHLVCDEHFQEALLLSNPNIYTIALPSYKRHYEHGSRSAKIRQLEDRFYAYIQRFCTKNETTSFFGPIDYGQFDRDARQPMIFERVEGGALAQRRTRMTYWAAETLAQKISEDKAMRPYLKPTLGDGFSLLPSGKLYCAVTNQSFSISEAAKMLLKHIDGHKNIQDIIKLYQGDFDSVFQKLLKQKIVTVSIRIPTAATDPLGWLYTYVSDLPDCASRSCWLQHLASFHESINHFTYAPATHKLRILQELERAFLLLTEQNSRRGEGALYADRLLLYDEAQGDITACIVGKKLHDRLLEQLRVPLHLCASYSVLLQKVCHQRAKEVFVAMGQGKAQPYLAFVRQIEAQLQIEDCIADPTIQMFLQRLTALVSHRTCNGQAHLNATDIQPFLQPIPDGTLVSPDVFISAPEAKNIIDNNFSIIIGEIHYGAQIWCHFLTFYNRLDELHAWLSKALYAPQHSTRIKGSVVHRRNQGKAFCLELPGLSIEVLGRSLKDRREVLPAADLEVVLSSGELALRSRSLDKLIELYPGDPRSISNWLFGSPSVVLPSLSLGGYTPRIVIDGTVLYRACWRLQAKDILPVHESRASDLLLHACALRQTYGLPQRCFARIPAERKPFYVDFTNVFSLEFLFTMIRNSTLVEFTEMLPAPDMWWLRDACGVRSCEWRMTLIYNSVAGNISLNSPLEGDNG